MVNKPFKTIDQQIDILRTRGAEIINYDWAKKSLLFHNYYKIVNGYDDIFILPNSAPKIYKKGVRFDQIYSVFAFDYRLRVLFLDQLTIIENKIKSLISYEHSRSYGPDGYLISSSFNMGEHLPKISNKQKWTYQCNAQNLISRLHSEFVRNINKPYIKKALFEDGKVPFWSFIGIITFGTLTKFYEQMKDSDRKIIANYFSVTSSELLSFMQLLTAARNLCAHNERIYCLNAIKLEIPREAHLTVLNYNHARNNLFSAIICFKHLLSKESFEEFWNSFENELTELRGKISKKQFLDLKQKMGLPPNWKDLKYLQN